VREHRQDIKRNRYLAQTLYKQLVGAVGARKALEALIIDETQVSEYAPGLTSRVQSGYARSWYATRYAPKVA
jgi:hypothetical protein